MGEGVGDFGHLGVGMLAAAHVLQNRPGTVETALPDQELRTLAELTGNVGGSAQVLVLEIATRPAGQACLADRGIVLS